MQKVFISHSSADIEITKQIYLYLSEHEIQCWVDVFDLNAGGVFSEQIVNAINDCSLFIVLISSACMKSINVLNEIDIAIKRKKRFLPILIEKAELTPAFEYYVASTQWLDLNSEKNKYQILPAVYEHVQKILAQKVPSPPDPKPAFYTLGEIDYDLVFKIDDQFYFEDDQFVVGEAKDITIEIGDNVLVTDKKSIFVNTHVTSVMTNEELCCLCLSMRQGTRLNGYFVLKRRRIM
ncbi:MAG: toll/interleukin-1 receptor domain-containing protein [Saccharofermentanales bacterium]|jgi:hypothetical protein